MGKIRRFETTSFMLHMMAMGFMFLDHLWATVIPGNQWLTDVGRLAFPLFAFMLVEGYFQTRDLKKYVTRLFILALVSQIPFNLITAGRIINPFEQNVIWTFLIGILLIHLNEKAKEKKKTWLHIIVAIVTIGLGFILGSLAMADYYYAGVYIILVFYFFRGKKWWNYVGQVVFLTYIYLVLMQGLSYEVNLFGSTYYLAHQGLGIFAQIPIWLYRGKQGPYNKGIKFLYYSFYPVHMLILSLIAINM